MKQVRYFLGFFPISILLTLGLYFSCESIRCLLEEEDSLVEELSALGFLAAGALSIFLVFSNKRNRGWLIVIAGIGFTGFLDEVGFGSRYFGFAMPVIAGKCIDSIHDIPTALVKFLIHCWPETPFLVAISCTAVLGCAAIIIWRHRRTLLDFISRNRRNPAFILMLFSVCLIVLSVVLDTEFLHHELLIVLEELCELNASIALLFSAWSLA